MAFRKCGSLFHSICIGLLVITFNVATTNAQIINEFMASNSSTLADEDGAYSDWIELYNPTTQAIALTNWSLTDDAGNLQKWTFPNTTLAANSYLVVFASDKNRNFEGQELHTNFKLSASGEYLALVDPAGVVITSFDPYPEQQPNFSYAFVQSIYAVATPTPGTENESVVLERLPKPVLSHTLGFYESPFDVIMTSTVGTQIFYTTDGSTPSASNGQLYTGPLAISTTTILRAVATKPGNIIGAVATQSYLFLESIINQPNNPPGYPTKWGRYTEIEGEATADYEMDPEITQDPRYKPLMKQALLAIPTLSLVTDKENLFSQSLDPEKGGIYIYTGPPLSATEFGAPGYGFGWERPASIEFFKPDGTRGFQVDCGLELHGGHSRRAEKSPKHSFRISFKTKYGPSTLDYPLFGENLQKSFNSLTLRAGFGNGIYHWQQNEARRMDFIRDIWAKATQNDMGHPSGHGIYAHLYINGIYWGIYNPTERIDGDYAAAYFGGEKEDYDIIKDYGDVVEGNIDTWFSLMERADEEFNTPEKYNYVLGKNADGTTNPDYESYVDVVSLIDYMILNFYGGNWDWDHHNWIAIRNRTAPGNGFKFFSWDAEHVLEDVTANILRENNADRPSGVFQKLIMNSTFRELFFQRVQVHCFNGGALTPRSASDRWKKFANEISIAIIAEYARWGDYRRDVHAYGSTNFPLFTKEHWLTEQTFVLNQYFPNRTNNFITHLKSTGLFSASNNTAPNFSVNGEAIYRDMKFKAGDRLSMTSTATQQYYTMDGTDPLIKIGDELMPSENAVLYTAPITLTKSTHIKARALMQTAAGPTWSIFSEQLFFLPDTRAGLKITEIHYHPSTDNDVDDRLLEFIEFKNTDDHPLDLSGVKIGGGISYMFPPSTTLMPGAFIVVAAKQREFYKYYSLTPFGEYKDFLNNSGERIYLVASPGDTILSVTFGDKTPWPESPDGDGYSLVPVNFNPVGDQTNPVDWRASLYTDGSPGKDDEVITAIAPETPNLTTSDLYQNYPNPFSNATTIAYTVAKSAHIKLTVYDILGKKITTLVDTYTANGTYTVSFANDNLSPGIYYYKLQVGTTFIKTKRMVVVEK